MDSEGRRRLFLVRHSLPDLDRGALRSEWHLSVEGERRCGPLADALSDASPQFIASSVEPKAVQTAQIIAERFGKPHRAFDGLHEHDRSNVEFLPAEDFDPAVASFFQSPDELVLGKETASQAQERFSAAAQTIIEDSPEGDIVIVSHGTVMALYVARWAGIPALPLWRRLGLPSFVALSLPEFEIVSLVESVA